MTIFSQWLQCVAFLLIQILFSVHEIRKWWLVFFFHTKLTIKFLLIQSYRISTLLLFNLAQKRKSIQRLTRVWGGDKPETIHFLITVRIIQWHVHRHAEASPCFLVCSMFSAWEGLAWPPCCRQWRPTYIKHDQELLKVCELLTTDTTIIVKVNCIEMKNRQVLLIKFKKHKFPLFC